MRTRNVAIIATALTFALVLLPAPVSAQNPNPNAIDIATEKPDKVLLEQLLSLERQYWSSWKAKDWVTVRKMMGEDGIWVDPLNVFSTEGFVKAVENGSLAFDIGPRAFLRKPAPDIVILVYDMKVGFGRAAATPAADWPWLLHAVFVKRGEQWVGISRSEIRGNRPPRPPS